jgi:hypothetical protein
LTACGLTPGRKRFSFDRDFPTCFASPQRQQGQPLLALRAGEDIASLRFVAACWN